MTHSPFPHSVTISGETLYSTANLPGLRSPLPDVYPPSGSDPHCTLQCTSHPSSGQYFSRFGYQSFTSAAQKADAWDCRILWLFQVNLFITIYILFSSGKTSLYLLIRYSGMTKDLTPVDLTSGMYYIHCMHGAKGTHSWSFVERHRRIHIFTSDDLGTNCENWEVDRQPQILMYLEGTDNELKYPKPRQVLGRFWTNWTNYLKADEQKHPRIWLPASIFLAKSIRWLPVIVTRQWRNKSKIVKAQSSQ